MLLEQDKHHHHLALHSSLWVICEFVGLLNDTLCLFSISLQFSSWSFFRFSFNTLIYFDLGLLPLVLLVNAFTSMTFLWALESSILVTWPSHLIFSRTRQYEDKRISRLKICSIYLILTDVDLIKCFMASFRR